MYTAPEIEITLLEAEDILTLSDGKGDNATDDDELF